ncbi:MAG: zinc-binding dehydrogenase [Chitinispirillaceae bacterium]|nr:zinc-binding dehydrogenase [Chitinispirillaceae bacterium]
MEKFSCVSKEITLNDVKKNQMNTAVIVSPKKILISSKTIRCPDDNQVRIKVQGCGICASNIPLWEGRSWFKYPCEEGSPGHEGWGIIEKKGIGVTLFNIGDRVTFLSNNSFSEYVNVNEKNVVKLPGDLDGIPFPGEPFGCAMNIFSRCSIKKGETVVIVGIGFIGAVLCALAVNCGAHVIAISKRRSSLSYAKKIGVAETIQLNDKYKVIDYVKKITSNELCDLVIEATGLQSCLDIASALTRVRGRLVIAGYHQDGLRTVDLQEWNWKGIDVINAHERDENVYVNGIKKALIAVSEGIVDPRELITHTFDFDSIQEAFEMALNRPEGFLKAVVVM